VFLFVPHRFIIADLASVGILFSLRTQLTYPHTIVLFSNLTFYGEFLTLIIFDYLTLFHCIFSPLLCTFYSFQN